MPDTAIAQADWYSQIGAPATQRAWPVVALVDESGNITGLAAAGVAIETGGDALEAIAANSLLANLTGGSAIPTAVTYDQLIAALKLMRYGTSDPAGGTDGDAIVRIDLGGLLRSRSAGVWGNVEPVTKTGEEIYDTYLAADHENESVFVTTWGDWTINEWFWSDGAQWWPVNRKLTLGDHTASATTTSTSNVILTTDTFPANMARGCFQMRAFSEYVGTTDATNTKSAKSWIGAAGAGTGGTQVSNFTIIAAGGVHAQHNVIVNFDSNSAQHHAAATVGVSGFFASGGARSSPTIDITADWEYACGGLVQNAAVSLGVLSRMYEFHFPSRKTA